MVTLSTTNWVNATDLQSITIPSEYRPKTNRWCSGIGLNNNSGSAMAVAVNILSNGAIGFTSETTLVADKSMFSVTYPV